MTEKELKEKGYSNAQIYLIMQKNKYNQQGGFFDYENQTYDNPYFGNTSINKPVVAYNGETPDLTGLGTNPNYVQPPMDNNVSGYNFSGTDLNLTDKEKKKLVNNINTKYQDVNRTNIYNPFTGISLENSIYSLGHGIGQKNPWEIGAGAGASLLKLGRMGLSGYATGKEDKRVQEDYYKNLFADQRKVEQLQQGGMKNSDILAMNALTNNPNGNTNTEGGEFIKRTDGMVQPVVGAKHIENGKIAEGVNVELNNGDKVLSDYVKLRPTDIKELKDRYNVSLKKGDTFAKAQSKIESKIGLKKETESLATLAEKLEKTLTVQDPTTKELNVNTLKLQVAKQNEKIAPLKEVSSYVFEDLFNRQEEYPKKDTSKLYDNNGNEVTETNQNTAQQGGMMIDELAKKHGISIERAKELMMMAQQGGIQSGQEEMQEGQSSNAQEEQGEISPEQIIQDYAQATQQDPQAIIQQLQQMSPEEQQQALIQMSQALQQGQQNPQEEQAEGQMSNPQEEEQEQPMQQGGKVYAQQGVNWQDRLNKDYVYGRQAETSYVGGAFEEPNYKYESIPDIAKRFKFLADQRGIDYSKLDLTTRDGVDQLAGLTQQYDKKNTPNLTQDYGQEIGLTKQGINYFTTTDTFKKLEKDNPTLANKLKNAKRGTYDVDNFTADERNTVMDKIKSSGDTTFADKNYLDNQAFFRGIDKKTIYFKDKEEFDKYKKEKGESKDGYYKTDKKGVYVKPILLQPKEFATEKEKQDWISKYGKNVEGQHNQFMAEDPNTDVYYTPFSAEQKPTTTTTPQADANIQVRSNTRQVMPQFPVDLRLPPSSIPPLLKSEINLNRIEPIKQTVEPYLAEQERQRVTAQEQLSQTGLPPQIQEALSGQQLAATQLASNDAISKVENFNRGQQYNADQFNIGQRAKEELSNQGYAQDYQNKMLGSIANTERDWRNFYIEGNLQNRANYQSVENANLLNASVDNYQYTPGVGIDYIGNNSADISKRNNFDWEKATAQEVEAEKQRVQNILNRKRLATQSQQ